MESFLARAKANAEPNKARMALIIDGNAFIYRFFFGNKDDPFCLERFIYMLKVSVKKLLGMRRYHFLVAVFDGPEPSFRKKLFTAYKAQRSPMPDDLFRALPEIQKMFIGLDFDLSISRDEYEGDDVVASFSESFARQNILSYVYTTDFDLLQLVSYWTTVFLMKRGLTVVEEYSWRNFGEKQQNLKPYQIPLLKALSGDASDNYPGIKGVGEKTASNLILKHKNLNNIYSNIEAIEGKLKEGLLAEREQLSIYLKLSNIVFDLPIKIEL